MQYLSMVHVSVCFLNELMQPHARGMAYLPQNGFVLEQAYSKEGQIGETFQPRGVFVSHKTVCDRQRPPEVEMAH